MLFTLSYPTIRAINSLVLMTITMSGMFASILVLEPATREFGTGRGLGALPYTLYMVGFGVGNIVMGRIMDRYGIAILAFTGSLCLPLGLYLASISQELWVFAATLSVLCGFLGSAFAFGPLVADISHWFAGRRGLAVGIVISGTYLAGAIWPSILQYWFDTHGWRTAFQYAAGFCLVTMMPLTITYFRGGKPDTSGDDQEGFASQTRPMGFSRGALQTCLCFAGIGCCVAMAMPQIHIVPYVLDLGFTARHGAFMLSLMLGFGIISRITSGWISDRIGGLKTLLLGSGMQGSVIFFFMFCDTLSMLYVASIAFGLSQGGIVPSYTIIIRRFFPMSEAGHRIGLAFVATTGGMALGGWLAGIIYDLTGSYTWAFINALAFNLTNFSIALYLLNRSRSRSTPSTPAPTTA